MLRRAVSPFSTLFVFLSEIRIEHTLFALPFAYTGAVLAARGIPSATQLLWITLAVLGARTAAMAANRYIDRDIDARNPRTARRALVSGKLSSTTMLCGIAAGIVLLIVAAAALSPLCVALLPIAALGIVLYPFCKRFTWGTHFVLGAVDGLAPLGAYIAIANTVNSAAVALFVAVTVWVAGFDIIYALMDRDIDLAQKIRSIPARFGASSGRMLPMMLHGVMFACLVFVGILAQPHILYYAGLILAVGLVFFEDWAFEHSKDVFVLNERIFIANMVFSLLFLITTILGYVV